MNAPTLHEPLAQLRAAIDRHAGSVHEALNVIRHADLSASEMCELLGVSTAVALRLDKRCRVTATANLLRGVSALEAEFSSTLVNDIADQRGDGEDFV